MSQRRERREFTDEFKQQVVNLYNNGKPRSEIIKEYDLDCQPFLDNFCKDNIFILNWY